jgi:hypothetical protein
VLLAVGDVRLVGGRAPDAHLGQGHHHLEHGHMLDNVHQLGRRAAAGHFQDRRAGYIDVDQHTGNVLRGGVHCLFCYVEI